MFKVVQDLFVQVMSTRLYRAGISVYSLCEKNTIRKGDPITSYLCSGGLIRGAYHNILKFNWSIYSSLDGGEVLKCLLYKLLISLISLQMNESPTVAACVSTGVRRCAYKSFSLSRFKVALFCVATII